MDAVEQSGRNAVDLVDQASVMLDAAGDRAGALRLRHTLAIIKNDGRYPAPAGLAAPVSLMKMALALLDREVSAVATTAAALLQEAIDHARGAEPLREGEELDPDLIPPLPEELKRPRLN